MFLRSYHVKNYRSIKDSGEIPLSTMCAFIGENNSGKSNLIRAIDVLISAGTAGVSKFDFNVQTLPIIIKGVFSDLTSSEKRTWKSYLVGGGNLILEKHLWIASDERTGKETIKTEFHGYRAEPKQWYFSISRIFEERGKRPKWKEIVREAGLPEYFLQDGECNKTLYEKALIRYLEENEIEYDDPDISETQALGLQSRVVSTLPQIYLLEAITDYSNEIDKRTSSTTFRRLMGSLADRILQHDPRFIELQQAINTFKKLLNKDAEEKEKCRLKSMELIENAIRDTLKRLMPSVQALSMSIEIEEIKDIFSRGVSLSVNDGTETDVLDKGHGLQRCIVFTLLQTLIKNEREQLFIHLEEEREKQKEIPKEVKPIILAVEEPELYIHPQLAKLFYDVLLEFSVTDQVIYTTHSPLFVDAFDYEHICIVSNKNPELGTKVKWCETCAFEGINERKMFKGLSRFNNSVNEMFFARKVLLVEGNEDHMAIIAVLQNDGIIKNRTEEIDWSIIVAGGKEAIPFFQRVLNAFSMPYTILHDLDIKVGMNENDKNTHQKTNAQILTLAGNNKVHNFPIKLEESLGLSFHFNDQYKAYQFFSDYSKITQEVHDIIKEIFV